MKARFFSLILALMLLCSCSYVPSDSSSSSASSATSSPSGDTSSSENATYSPFTLGAYALYGFHPVLSNSQANLTLAPLLYESLFSVNGQFEAEPVLCDSYTVSEDGLVWTFSIRSGINFSDGTSLTGEIVADALTLAKSPASFYASRLSEVSSIRGTGQQVTITLSTPNGSFPTLLDIPIALGEGERPLGTGPYVLSETGTHLSLIARSDWWQGSSQLPVWEIPLTSIGKAENLITAFDSGEVSLIDADLTGNDALGYSGSYQVWDYASTNFVYLGYNTRQGLCRDVEIRKAIAQSIDREQICESVFARHAVEATLPVHPNSALYDTELAQSLALKSNAFEGLDLSGRSLTLLVNIENTAKSTLANLIAKQLELASGISVTVDRLPWEEYLEALSQGDFDLYLGEVSLSADFNLTQLLSPTGTLNYGGWNNSACGAMIASMQSSAGEERQVAARRLYSYLNQWCPIAPICFKNGTVLTQYGRVSNLSPVQNNLFFHLSQWTVE